MLSRPLGKKWIIAAGLMVVVLWALSHLGVRVAATHLYGGGACAIGESKKTDDVERYQQCLLAKNEAQGAFGDSFGAVNALFTGLALAGLVLTLVMHSEGARRVAKPFVIPALDRAEPEARVSVGLPNRAAGQVTLPIEVVLPIRNESDHPALNLTIILSAPGARLEVDRVVDLPIAGRSGRVTAIQSSVSGDAASDFVARVSAEGLELSVELVCESVEGVKWRSSVRYLVRVDPARAVDLDLLRQAIDGPVAEPALWAGNAQVDLLFAAVPGSWSYQEVAGVRARSHRDGRDKRGFWQRLLSVISWFSK